MIIVTANVGLLPLKSGKKREPLSVRSKRPKHFRREGHAFHDFAKRAFRGLGESATQSSGLLARTDFVNVRLNIYINAT